MNSACFLTTIDNPEPLNWGLKLDKIATPMILFCSRDMAETLTVQSVPPSRQHREWRTAADALAK